MTPRQITELEAIWECEIGARKSPWEAALACVEHIQKRKRKKAPAITIEEAEKLVQEAYSHHAPSDLSVGSEYRAGALDLRDGILSRLRALR